MISAQNISKTFKLYQSPSDRLKEIIFRRCYHKEYHALQNISFEVGEGETFGIVGQNGAGKSTLLKILTGVLIPDRGQVTVDGRITGLLELGTGFNNEFSGKENIFLNGGYLGLSHSEVEKRLERIVEFTELADFIDEPIKTYSSGMIMRLAFSIAIHADPSAFVIDEALSVGDAYFQQKCMRKIKEFKDSGGSIVFVSHSMNAVKVLCDRAMLLLDGACVEIGDPEPVINTYNYLVAKRTKGEELKFHASDTGESSYGNEKITINGVQLLDEQGNSVAVAQSGGPVQVKINLTAHETIAEITVGIAIRDKFGQDIFGTNSFYLNCPISVEEAKSYSVLYRFDEFNIGAGKYSITVAAHSEHEHTNECYNWIDKSLAFEVVQSGDYSFIGLSRLTPHLSIEDME
ncbi:MAG: ABC transporter ATP-binding protein [Desulfocapsa sp.]|nr:ABC transporter ATP-binding protein [Desulfocapsa sp.]